MLRLTLVFLTQHISFCPCQRQRILCVAEHLFNTWHSFNLCLRYTCWCKRTFFFLWMFPRKKHIQSSFFVFSVLILLPSHRSQFLIHCLLQGHFEKDLFSIFLNKWSNHKCSTLTSDGCSYIPSQNDTVRTTYNHLLLVVRTQMWPELCMNGKL